MMIFLLLFLCAARFFLFVCVAVVGPFQEAAIYVEHTQGGLFLNNT